MVAKCAFIVGSTLFAFVGLVVVNAFRSGRRDDFPPPRTGWPLRTAGPPDEPVAPGTGGNKYHKDPALSDPRFLDRRKYNFNYHVKSRQQPVVDNRSWLESNRRQVGGMGARDPERAPFRPGGPPKPSTMDRDRYMEVPVDDLRRPPIFQDEPPVSDWDRPSLNRPPLDPLDEIPLPPPYRRFDQPDPPPRRLPDASNKGDRRFNEHERYPDPDGDRRYYYAPAGSAMDGFTRGRKFRDPASSHYQNPAWAGDKDAQLPSGDAGDYLGNTKGDSDPSFFDPIPHRHLPSSANPDRKPSNDDTSHDSRRPHQQSPPGGSPSSTSNTHGPSKADLDVYLEEFHRLLAEHEEQVRRQQEHLEQQQQQQQLVGTRRRFHGDPNNERHRNHGMMKPSSDFDRRPPWFRDSSASAGGATGGDLHQRPLLAGQMDDLIAASSDSFFMTAPSNAGAISNKPATSPSAKPTASAVSSDAFPTPPSSLSATSMTISGSSHQRNDRREDLPGLRPSLIATTPGWTSIVKFTTPKPSISATSKPTSIYPELNTTKRRTPENSRKLVDHQPSLSNFDAANQDLELLPALEDILNHVETTASGTPVIDPSKLSHEIWNQIHLHAASKDPQSSSVSNINVGTFGKHKKPNDRFKTSFGTGDFGPAIASAVTTTTGSFVSSTISSIFTTTPKPMTPSTAHSRPVAIPTLKPLQTSRPNYWSEKYGGIVVSPEDEFAILSSANLPGLGKYLANARPIITGPSGPISRPMVTKTSSHANPVTFVASTGGNRYIFNQGNHQAIGKNRNENGLPFLYGSIGSSSNSSSAEDKRSFGSNNDLPFSPETNNFDLLYGTGVKPVDELPMAFQPHSGQDLFVHEKPGDFHNNMPYDHTPSPAPPTTTTESFPTIFTTTFRPLSQIYGSPMSTVSQLHPTLPPVVSNANRDYISSTVPSLAVGGDGAGGIHESYQVPNFNKYFGGNTIAGNPLYGNRPIQLADLYSGDHASSIYGPHSASLFKSHDPSTADFTADASGTREENLEQLLQQLGIQPEDYAQEADGHPQHQSHTFSERASNASFLNTTVAEQLFGNSTQGMTQAQKVAAAIGLGIVPSMVALFPLLFFGRRRRRRRSIDDASLADGVETSDVRPIRSTMQEALHSLQTGLARWGTKGKVQKLE